MITTIIGIILCATHTSNSLILDHINTNGFIYQLFNYSRVTRSLIGSNCVFVERGVVTPYYKCIGCVIEEAMGCLDDMRYNRSYTVHPGCKMASIHEEIDGIALDTSCCPIIAPIPPSTSLDLHYLGSSYPEALRCVANKGCGASAIYDQLLLECQTICSSLGPDPRNNKDICLAAFNSAYRRHHHLSWIATAIISTIMIVYMGS